MCLRHNYAVFKIEVLTIFITAVAIHQVCLWAIREALEYTLVLLLVVCQAPPCRTPPVRMESSSWTAIR